MGELLKICLSLAIAGFLCGGPSGASPLGAEFKLQETLGFDQAGTVGSVSSEPGDFQFSKGSLRLKSEERHGSWTFDAHLLIGANYSKDWQWLSSETPSLPAKAFFDLDTEASSGTEGNLTLNIDRAAINYTSNRYTVKIGRQALTWGNAKIFNPMDRFAPFSPRAQDTSYKVGSDMLYVQRLFDSGADLQMIYLPRRSLTTDRVSESLSSLAAKYLFSKGSWQFEALGAEDWDDEIAGGSAVGPLGSALWSTDLVYTRLAEGGEDLALTSNLQHAWTWYGKPTSGFLEYAHNGLGVTQASLAQALPSQLRARIQRGQYFNTGRDYLGIGFTAQWNPLLTVSPSAILNLHDRSGIALMSAQWNASDCDRVVLGLQAPFGSDSSEYGSATSPSLLYLRWERFF